MPPTQEPASPTQSVPKGSSADEVEDVLTYPNLSPEDSQWLAEFPADRKKQAVRKVRQGV